MSATENRYREHARTAIAESQAINSFLKKYKHDLNAMEFLLSEALCNAEANINDRVQYLPPNHYPAPEITQHRDSRFHTPLRHYILTHFTRENAQLMNGDFNHQSLEPAPASAEPLFNALDACNMSGATCFDWHLALLNSGTKEGLRESGREVVADTHAYLQRAKTAMEAIIQAFEIDDHIITSKTALDAQKALDYLDDHIIPAFGGEQNEMIERMLKYSSRAEAVKRQTNPHYDAVAKEMAGEAAAEPTSRTPAAIVAAGAIPSFQRGRKNSPDGEGIY